MLNIKYQRQTNVTTSSAKYFFSFQTDESENVVVSFKKKTIRKILEARLQTYSKCILFVVACMSVLYCLAASRPHRF